MSEHMWCLLYMMLIYSFLRITTVCNEIFAIAVINIVLYAYYSISVIFLKAEFFYYFIEVWVKFPHVFMVAVQCSVKHTYINKHRSGSQ
jgi:hypothetical protein